MKLLLVDDHILFREGLTSLLDSQMDLTVVGAAKSVASAVVKVRELQPDLVLMGFNLPDGTGLDATRSILAERPDTHIVLLTVRDDDERLFEAIRCGAKRYLLKSSPAVEMLDYLRTVSCGETTISQKMTNRILPTVPAMKYGRTMPENMFLS